MNKLEDLTKLSDPEFLDERRRVRETIEDLQEQYRLLTIEFDRRRRPSGARHRERTLSGQRLRAGTGGRSSSVAFASAKWSYNT